MPFEHTLQLCAQREADQRYIPKKANAEHWYVKGIINTKPSDGRLSPIPDANHIDQTPPRMGCTEELLTWT
jgi:hypothetical protein